MSGYLGDFIALASVHFLAVVAPGPDFAVTIRQSVRFGRRAGVFTAIGIGAGISVHVIYTLLGVSALMHATPWLLKLVEILGGAYLFYLGCNFIRACSDKNFVSLPEIGGDVEGRNSYQSFMLGFLTNATNPKATLFFLAVFTAIVSDDTPLYIQVFYGIWMCFINAVWFIFVSVVFTSPGVRESFLKIGYLFEKLIGALLIFFSMRILWGYWKK